MYLWEIPKTDNIIISFDLSEKHFNFKTSLIPIKSREENTVYAEPIIISGNILRMDKRCKNITINYLNQRSGRTHIWNDVLISYEKPPKNLYIITSEKDSKQINRRKAVRISVNKKSDCSISMLEGKYECIINDISVTGIGINIDVRLADKNLYHRVINTHFVDETIKKHFKIEARCLHSTKIDAKTVRCGCEIISVTPPINEYINAKQLHKLAKSSLREEEKGYDDSDGENAVEEEKAGAEAVVESTGAAANGSVMDSAGRDDVSVTSVIDSVTNVINVSEAPEPTVAASAAAAQAPDEGESNEWMKGWVSDPAVELPIGEGEICPVCEKGVLRRSQGFFICTSCGSMLD